MLSHVRECHVQEAKKRGVQERAKAEQAAQALRNRQSAHAAHAQLVRLEQERRRLHYMALQQHERIRQASLAAHKAAYAAESAARGVGAGFAMPLAYNMQGSVGGVSCIPPPSADFHLWEQQQRDLARNQQREKARQARERDKAERLREQQARKEAKKEDRQIRKEVRKTLKWMVSEVAKGEKGAIKRRKQEEKFRAAAQLRYERIEIISKSTALSRSRPINPVCPSSQQGARSILWAFLSGVPLDARVVLFLTRTRAPSLPGKRDELEQLLASRKLFHISAYRDIEHRRNHLDTATLVTDESRHIEFALRSREAAEHSARDTEVRELESLLRAMPGGAFRLNAAAHLAGQQQSRHRFYGAAQGGVSKSEAKAAKVAARAAVRAAKVAAKADKLGTALVKLLPEAYAACPEPELAQGQPATDEEDAEGVAGVLLAKMVTSIECVGDGRPRGREVEVRLRLGGVRLAVGCIKELQEGASTASAGGGATGASGAGAVPPPQLMASFKEDSRRFYPAGQRVRVQWEGTIWLAKITGRINVPVADPAHADFAGKRTAASVSRCYRAISQVRHPQAAVVSRRAPFIATAGGIKGGAPSLALYGVKFEYDGTLEGGVENDRIRTFVEQERATRRRRTRLTRLPHGFPTLLFLVPRRRQVLYDEGQGRQ